LPLAVFGGKNLNRSKMATITDKELQDEFDEFGVELDDLIIIEECMLLFI
jgi:hypothetical protein